MGNELYTGSGTPVKLEEKLGEGGEALIFDTSRSGLCAKVYGNNSGLVDRVDSQKHRKLRLMVQNPPEDPADKGDHCSFAWPEEVLYQEPAGRRCVGFLMPRIDTGRFLELYTCKLPSSRRERFGGRFTWKNLFFVGFNLASAVAALHEKGYCIGDINGRNILVDHKRTLITIIDCDSFQVSDPDSGQVFPCPVGTPEYTAPELSQQAKRYEDMERTPESDAFALSAMIFELLMEGTRPYQGIGPALNDAPSTSAKLKKGLFPYISENREVEPPPHAPPFKILHPRLRDLFTRCFDEGHGHPDRRPMAGQWFRVLGTLQDNFRQCENNDDHLFLNHLKDCPWCEWSPPGVDDCFPSSYGQQVQVEGPSVSRRERLNHLKGYVETAAADGTITKAEKRKLEEKAKELDLEKSDVEKLVKKSGASTTRKKPTSTGTPELEVEENRIQHEDLAHGATPHGTITFSNVGGGNLQGSLKVKGGGWLSIDRSSIDPSKHRQKVRYRIDTSNLAYGDSPRAHIQIHSNGGNYEIPVSVSVETPEEATKRWRMRVGLSGLPVGALFGVVASAFPIPAVAGVSTGVAFLAGSLVFSAIWAAIGGLVGSFVGSFVDSPGGCAAVGAPIGFIGGFIEWFSNIKVQGSSPHEFVEMLGGMGTGEYVLLSAASWAFLFAITGALPAKLWAQVKSRGDSLKMYVAGVWGSVALVAILVGGAFSGQLDTQSFTDASKESDNIEVEDRKSGTSESKHQTISVKGTVVDSKTGEPIPNVGVYVIGRDDKKFTEKDGNFEVRLMKGRRIVFSHNDYKNKNVKVKDDSDIRVKLKRGRIILIWKEAALRERKSRDSEVLGWISRGVKIEYLRKDGNYYRVKYEGRYGYLHESLIDPEYRK